MVHLGIPSRPPMPVTVIGGYLGAGKTTLLNRLLAEAEGRRLAVLVNDFGEINIDTALVASRSSDAISLANGCVCCSIGDDLGDTLYDLAERADGPEHIVIEASGVADPGRIANYAGCHPRLRLDGIVVVADVETVQARAADKYVGDVVGRQLDSADLIVLSRTDLVGAAATKAVRNWIADKVPRARIYDARAGQGAIGLLLVGGSTGDALPWREAGHHGMFRSWRFSSALPIDEAKLRGALATLPAVVIRAKGIVSLAGEPGRRFVLQVVGRRWSLEPDQDKRATFSLGRSEIVVIGLADAADADSLAALFMPTAPAILPAPTVALLKGENRR